MCYLDVVGCEKSGLTPVDQGSCFDPTIIPVQSIVNHNSHFD